MTPIEHLYQCLQEEAAEIIQDASKVNRFGPGDVNFLEPGGPDNRARLVLELNDLVAVAEMLAERGELPLQWMDRQRIQAKKEKVLRMMVYSRKVGALKNEAPDLAEAALAALDFLKATKAECPRNGAEDEAWTLRIQELEAALK